MNDKIFDIKARTNENNGTVIIKVIDDRHDPLFVAAHPFIDSHYRYISVTGTDGCSQHLLTVVDDNAAVIWSDEWGRESVCVGGRAKLLRHAVIDYLASEGINVA